MLPPWRCEQELRQNVIDRKGFSRGASGKRGLTMGPAGIPLAGFTASRLRPIDLAGAAMTAQDGEISMDRRTVLKGLAGVGSLAATGGLSMPALSQGAAARTLKFVPQANLANFDPIWGTQYVVRNAAALVWDTLYGVDATLQPQRQMVESEEVTSDGLTWTFKLRPGLKFHDGEPVLAKDVVSSLTRWMARDSMGLMIKALQKELTAVDDRTVKLVLSAPYPKILFALGKNNTPMGFVMPER